MFHVEQNKRRGEYMITRNNLPQDFLDKMALYETELVKWNATTDLIGNSTLDDFFERHILNSLQFITYLKKTDLKIADIGTGAGLPGLVCAAYDKKRTYYLFEKKKQKLIFLKQMQALLQLKNVKIMSSFTEKTNIYFDVLTSRALLSLTDIMYYKKYVKSLILFKGRDYSKEIKSLNDGQHMNNIEIFNAYNDDSFFLKG